MYIAAAAGLVVGALINYFANKLLYIEGLVSKSAISLSLNKWQYLLMAILTSLLFASINWYFSSTSYAIGMLVFISALLFVCITDFKAKIIPHEITYPAILLGIVFSIYVRTDVWGALAGIGVSYILFDFLAFYGLKVYIWLNKLQFSTGESFYSKESVALGLKQEGSTIAKDAGIGSNTRTEAKKVWLSAPSICGEKKIEKESSYKPKLSCKGMPLEELEIIGGGDAVLSALIAAWLGWQKLVIALIASFLVGTVLGAAYLLIELRRERLIKTIIKPVVISIIGLCTLAGSTLYIFSALSHLPILNTPYSVILPLAAVAGFLLGTVLAGTKISKPFPFGPALAVGALFAIFIKQ